MNAALVSGILATKAPVADPAAQRQACTALDALLEIL